jgi:PBP1b-binding outer membrane lipoprotein LpoB
MKKFASLVYVIVLGSFLAGCAAQQAATVEPQPQPQAPVPVHHHHHHHNHSYKGEG